jgi:hypothetical protein
MPQNVIAVFRNGEDAARAVDELISAGFPRRDVSLLVSDDVRRTLAPEDKAAKGAATGSALGAIAGGLTAIASLAVPGGVFAAGPLLALLGGAVVGAAGGGLVGFLVGLGIPEHRARTYEQTVREGGYLVAAKATTRDRAEAAERIFERNGAAQMDRQARPTPPRDIPLFR